MKLFIIIHVFNAEKQFHKNKYQINIYKKEILIY